MLHFARWFLTSIICIFIKQTVTSLSVESLPENSDMLDMLLRNPEVADTHEIPIVSRRGYAGDEFYHKASKSIPRMGRRSEPNTRTCSCVPEGLDEFWQDDALMEPTNADSIDRVKRERSYSRYGFPWHTDSVKNLASKRTKADDKCYYSPKHKNYVSEDEICNESMICCPIVRGSSVFKRVQSSRISKQTSTRAPDYKSNQFMKK